MSTGKKYDQGKPRFEFAPMELAAGANRAMTYGAAKYQVDNWKGGLDHTRLANAAIRHLVAYLQGEDIDPESGLPHLDHAAASTGMLMASIERGYGKDDRPSKAVKFPGSDTGLCGYTTPKKRYRRRSYSDARSRRGPRRVCLLGSFDKLPLEVDCIDEAAEGTFLDEHRHRLDVYDTFKGYYEEVS